MKRKEIEPTIKWPLVRLWRNKDPLGFAQFVADLGKPLEGDTLQRIVGDKRELAQYPLEFVKGEV